MRSQRDICQGRSRIRSRLIVGEVCFTQDIVLRMKTLRGSYDRETKQKPLTLVSAWASSHRLVLGQLKVNDKSNEITAIPEPYVQVISQQLAEIQFLDTEA